MNFSKNKNKTNMSTKNKKDEDCGCKDKETKQAHEGGCKGCEERKRKLQEINTLIDNTEDLSTLDLPTLYIQAIEDDEQRRLAEAKNTMMKQSFDDMIKQVQQEFDDMPNEIQLDEISHLRLQNFVLKRDNFLSNAEVLKARIEALKANVKELESNIEGMYTKANQMDSMTEEMLDDYLKTNANMDYLKSLKFYQLDINNGVFIKINKSN
jgi:methyl-accepting chemotaxis protein